jgi:hypothetical protein
VVLGVATGAGRVLLAHGLCLARMVGETSPALLVTSVTYHTRSASAPIACLLARCLGIRLSCTYDCCRALG